MKAFLVKSLEEANRIIKRQKGDIISIECEWGDKKPENVKLALHHHGKDEGNLAPSALYRAKMDLDIKDPVLLFSHLDLDALFGAMWVCQKLDPQNELHIKIAKLVEIADVYGPHYIKENWDDEVYKKWVTCGFIMNRNNRILDLNVTKIVKELMNVMVAIINDDDIDNNPVFEEAYEWKTKISKNAISFIRYNTKYVLGFVSNKFMLSNYNLLSRPRPIMIQFNPKSGKISMSVVNNELAIKLFGEGGVDSIMKKYFGPEAGGKTSIGGSPRFKPQSFYEFKQFAKDIHQIAKEKLTDEDIKSIETIGTF